MARDHKPAGDARFERYRRQVVIDGEVLSVHLMIDWFNLFRDLAKSAKRNRSKQTRACGGLIRAKVKPSTNWRNPERSL